MRRIATTLTLTLAVTAGPALGPAVLRASQSSSLESLLARATDYVVKYFEVMSLLTAEEHYVQDVVMTRPVIPMGSAGIMTMGGQQRKDHDLELRSDVNLVNAGPPAEWRVYRDVYEVNKKPVRDRTDRLAKLILEPAASARIQAERIASESARFNISNVGRVLNEPGLPMVFLQKALQLRFAFTLDKRDGNAWIVKYTETARPTIFKHNNTLDNPSSGRFWIDASTGEVSKAEMLMSPAPLKIQFTTSFKHDNRFGVAVPAQMHEQVAGSVDMNARRLEGTAEYSNYRKFGVKTEESVK